MAEGLLGCRDLASQCTVNASLLSPVGREGGREGGRESGKERVRERGREGRRLRRVKVEK